MCPSRIPNESGSSVLGVSGLLGLFSSLLCFPNSSLTHIPPPQQHLLYLPLPLTNSAPQQLTAYYLRRGFENESHFIEEATEAQGQESRVSKSYNQVGAGSRHSDPGLSTAQTPSLSTFHPTPWSGSTGRALETSQLCAGWVRWERELAKLRPRPALGTWLFCQRFLLIKLCG